MFAKTDAKLGCGLSKTKSVEGLRDFTVFW